jgi:3-oxoisoapionate decarboxylase
MRRRDFLLSPAISALPLAAILAPSVRAQAPPGQQPLGLNSYCLRAMRWRDKEILDYAADLKLEGVFLQDSTDPDAGSLDHWKEVGQYARQLNLHIETGVGAVLPKDATQTEASREQLLLGIDRAKAVGSPLVRCLLAADRAHLPPGPIDQHIQTMVRLLRSVRSQAMDANLKIAIENHKDLQAWEMREVIEAAGKDFVGSYLDTGNPVFVVEDPLTTLEILGPYALCVHLRDSVIYEYQARHRQDDAHHGGAMVQWVPLGDGVIDFVTLTQRLRAIKPDVYVYIKPITGRPPQLIPYLDPDFWKDYPKARAAELARFVELAKRGSPYEKNMVVEDLPGRVTPPPFVAAIQFQQRQHMERSVEYAKKTLNLGSRWRNS